MSQHIPDRMYICSVFQQVRGEGMTEGVGSNILLYPRHLLVVFDYLPETLSGHMFATYVHEEGLLTWAQDHLWSYQSDIITEGFDGGRIHGDETFRITVYTPYHARLQVNIQDLQIDQLRDANACGIQQLKHCLITVALGVDAIGLSKKVLYFPAGQDFRKLLDALFRREALRGIDRDNLFDEEMSIKTLYGGNCTGNGGD